MNEQVSKRLLQLFSVAAIYLVVSFTYAIAHSLPAAAVLQGTAYGSDNIEGYRKTEDSLTVLADADSPDVAITGPNGNIPMDCSETEFGLYFCRYDFVRNTQPAGAFMLDLIQQNPADMASVRYLVDGVGPRFPSMSITQIGSTISVRYSAIDSAGPGDAGKCAGLRNVNLLIDGRIVATEDIEGGCTHTGVINVEFPGYMGEAEFQLTGRDQLGNEGESQLQRRMIDTVAPVMRDSFQAIRNGVVVEKVSTVTPLDIRVTITFNVSEPNLQQVVVDARALTGDPSLQSAYRALRATCVDRDGINVCEIPNVQYRPSESPVPINITALDRFGNAESIVARTNVEVINELPSVDSWGCDPCYMRRGINTIHASVNAPGGLAGHGFIVRVGNPGQARPNRVAAACSGAFGGYTCNASFELLQGRTGDVIEVAIDPYSHDDLGNPFAERPPESFIVDNEAPEFITEPTFTNPCPTVADMVNINFTVREETSATVRLRANLTSVTTYARFVEEECVEQDEGVYDCLLRVDQFQPDPTRGDIIIDVYDEAGNTATKRMRVEVCEMNQDQKPNYIRYIEPSVRDLPFVDERIAQILPFRVAIPLRIDMLPGASIVDMISPRCFGDHLSGDVRLMHETSKAPTLILHFQGNQWPGEYTQVNCTFEFIMRRGSTVYAQPETQEMDPIRLPLAGRNLGNPSDAIESQMEDLGEEIQSLQGEIDKWQKWDDRLSTLCGTVEYLVKADQALQVVKSVLTVVAAVMMAIPPLAAAGQQLMRNATEYLSSVVAFLEKLLFKTGSDTSEKGGFGVLGGISEGILQNRGFLGIGSQVSRSSGEAQASEFDLGDKGTQVLGRIIKNICAFYHCNMFRSDTMVRIGMDFATTRDWYGDLFDKPEETIGPGYYEETKTSVSINPLYTSGILESGTMNPNDFAFNDFLIITEQTVLVPAHGPPAPNPEYDHWVDRQLQANLQWAAGMPGNNWIIDPYRSEKYDALCIPARLYNLNKKQQLKCMLYKCKSELNEQGLSTAICDKQHRALTCLYVEGAQGQVGGGWFQYAAEALAYGVLQGIVGMAKTWLMHKLCKPLYRAQGMPPEAALLTTDEQGNEVFKKDVGAIGDTRTAGGGTLGDDISEVVCSAPDTQQMGNQAASWDYGCIATSVFCGLFMTYESVAEVEKIFERNQQYPTEPGGEDFCSGLVS